MAGQAGFFDVEDRLKRLSDLGDQLEAFAAVDFEIFRPALDAALAYSDGAKGGRPPLDPVGFTEALATLPAEWREKVRQDRDGRWSTDLGPELGGRTSWGTAVRAGSVKF